MNTSATLTRTMEENMGLIFSALNSSQHKAKVSKAFAFRSYFSNDNCSAILQTSVTHLSLAAWDKSVIELSEKKTNM